MNHMPSNKASFKDIKITVHAKQRAAERLHIFKEAEIQKLACSAKYKGIKIRALNSQNYSALNISYDMYRHLKNHFALKTNSEQIYYYKDFVYVFAGGSARTLKSIIPCSEADMKKAIEKLDKNRIQNKA